MTRVHAGDIDTAHISSDNRTVTGKLRDGESYTTIAPSDIWLVSDLLNYGVKVTGEPLEQQNFLISIL